MYFRLLTMPIAGENLNERKSLHHLDGFRRKGEKNLMHEMKQKREKSKVSLYFKAREGERWILRNEEVMERKKKNT